ncbi:hypothetical protein, partial [Rhodoplanes sp. SY1]|uniref:hypothetical protein n=1 Tax=Rhodoplanes sp. SY1 TaxID=3166646 RepID=UPI0038B5516E
GHVLAVRAVDFGSGEAQAACILARLDAYLRLDFPDGPDGMPTTVPSVRPIWREAIDWLARHAPTALAGARYAPHAVPVHLCGGGIADAPEHELDRIDTGNGRF